MPITDTNDDLVCHYKNGLTIREYTPEDADALEKFSCLFSGYARTLRWEADIHREYTRLLIAVLANKIIGAVAIAVNYNDKTRNVRVYDLAVCPHHRYKGVGTALMKEARKSVGNTSTIWLIDASNDNLPWMRQYHNATYVNDTLVSLREKHVSKENFYEKLNLKHNLGIIRR